MQGEVTAAAYKGLSKALDILFGGDISRLFPCTVDDVKSAIVLGLYERSGLPGFSGSQGWRIVAARNIAMAFIEREILRHRRKMVSATHENDTYADDDYGDSSHEY